MSPFLPTLFTVALVEIGSATAQFSGSLAARGTSEKVAVRALGAITVVVMTIAAIGCYAMSNVEDMIPRVKTLLLGMALIWAAISQFRLLKPLAAVEGQNANVIALRGYARLALSGSAGFLVFAIALYSGGGVDALVGAAIGGWIGMMAANVPPLFFTRRQLRKMHIDWLRTAAGSILALVGFIYALTALKLLG